MSEYLMSGEARDVVIDIGEDGGKLTIISSVPPVYMINGGVVNEAAAYAWVHHWHVLRDHAEGGSGRCTCDPCVKTRKLHHGR